MIDDIKHRSHVLFQSFVHLKSIFLLVVVLLTLELMFFICLFLLFWPTHLLSNLEALEDKWVEENLVNSSIPFKWTQLWNPVLYTQGNFKTSADGSEQMSFADGVATSSIKLKIPLSRCLPQLLSCLRLISVTKTFGCVSFVVCLHLWNYVILLVVVYFRRVEKSSNKARRDTFI